MIEYVHAYQMVQHDRNEVAAERDEAVARCDEYASEYSILSCARETQYEYLQSVQMEVKAVHKKGNDFIIMNEEAMNEMDVAQQSKVAQFNEHAKEFQLKEAKRKAREAEWANELGEMAQKRLELACQGKDIEHREKQSARKEKESADRLRMLDQQYAQCKD